MARKKPTVASLTVGTIIGFTCIAIAMSGMNVMPVRKEKAPRDAILAVGSRSMYTPMRGRRDSRPGIRGETIMPAARGAMHPTVAIPKLPPT